MINDKLIESLRDAIIAAIAIAATKQELCIGQTLGWSLPSLYQISIEHGIFEHAKTKNLFKWYI